MSRIPVQGPSSAPGDKKRREQLDELYAELPKIECKGLCAESCGPVPMGRVEWQRVCRAGGERAAKSDLVCPYLEDERCAVYEVRPMMCRLWGVVDEMPCLWGCKPERYLTREEGFEFVRRAAEIQLEQRPVRRPQKKKEGKRPRKKRPDPVPQLTPLGKAVESAKKSAREAVKRHEETADRRRTA